MRPTLVLLLLFLIATSAWAGTFRDDFEKKRDFLADKRLREGGVWGEDIDCFSWAKGAIKGTPNAKWVWLLITGDYGWEDYTVECKVKPLEDHGAVGLVARRTCIDCAPGYTFAIDFSAGQVAIEKDAPGVDEKDAWNILTGSPFSPEVDRWYSLKAVAEGKRFDFYLDGELVAEAENAAHPRGKAGFYVWKGTALFDDFVMTGPEVEDGGHWNTKAHPEPKPVQSMDKLATKWGEIKYN